MLVLNYSFFYGMMRTILFSWRVIDPMDKDPPKWWQLVRLRILWYLPQEPRKKIKRLLKLGDEYARLGSDGLAARCYDLSHRLADRTGVIHLQKQIQRRFSENN